MKILYAANIRMPTEKAHGVQIMKMCEAFSLRGESVTLAVSSRFTNIKERPHPYYRVEENFEIKKIFSPGMLWAGRFGYVAQNFLFTFSLLIHLFFNKYDVVYSRDDLAVYVLSLFRKNVFWETHTKKADNFIIRGILSHADGIVAISVGLRRYYVDQLNANEEKFYVAHDAADLSDFITTKNKIDIRKELSLPDDKMIISYVGKMKTMGESKGVEQLMDSFPFVLEKKKDAFLLLVGFNREEVSLAEAKMIDLRISKNNYKIVQHIPRSDVPLYLIASDLLIMNYPNTEHYALYMSPLKLFEYMASGVPMISTDLPSIREVLDERECFYIKEGEKLEDKIISVLNDMVFAGQVASAARAKMAKYTWEERASSIINFVKNNLQK